MNHKNIISVVIVSILVSCVPQTQASDKDTAIIGGTVGVGLCVVGGLVWYHRKTVREHYIRGLQSESNRLLEKTNKYLELLPIANSLNVTYENLKTVSAKVDPLEKYTYELSRDITALEQQSNKVRDQKITSDQHVLESFKELMNALNQKRNTITPLKTFLETENYKPLLSTIPKLTALKHWIEHTQQHNTALFGYKQPSGEYHLFAQMSSNDMRNYVIGAIHRTRPLLAYVDQAGQEHAKGKRLYEQVQVAPEKLHGYQELREEIEKTQKDSNYLQYVLNDNRTHVIASQMYREELAAEENAESLRRQTEAKEREALASEQQANAARQQANAAQQQVRETQRQSTLLEEHNRQQDIANRVAEERRLDTLWNAHVEQLRLRGQAIPDRNAISSTYGGHKEKNIAAAVSAGIALANAIIS